MGYENSAFQDGIRWTRRRKSRTRPIEIPAATAEGQWRSSASVSTSS